MGLQTSQWAQNVCMFHLGSQKADKKLRTVEILKSSKLCRCIDREFSFRLF